MTGTFSYVWDRQCECWQIVSRSGHIVFQSEEKEHVRQMCQQLERRVATAGPAVRRPAHRAAAPHNRVKRPSVVSRLASCLPTISWPVVVTSLGLLIGAALAMPPAQKCTAQAQTAEVYRATIPVQKADAAQVTWVTEMQERKVRVARPIVETKQVEQRVKVLRPVVETVEREETVLVRRPVVETSVRYEKVTVNEPVTVYDTKQVDQGYWAQAQSPAPIQSKTTLRWVPGGYSTDAQTGVTSWKLPMFRFVKEPVPVVSTAQRVWKPNVVATQVPRTTYRQRIETRPVQVQTVRYVEEKQVRKVPVQVKRMVEQEEVRQVPVSTERMTYEERIDRVPVKVCRRVPAGQAPSQPAAAQPASPSLDEPSKSSSPAAVPDAKSSMPAPRTKTEPQRAGSRTGTRLQPELRKLETMRVAQNDATDKAQTP